MEELTGTEIYSQISIQVFQNCRELEQQQQITQAKLSGLQLLSAEQLAELGSAEQQLLAAQQLQLDAQQQLQPKLDWWTQCEAATTQQQQARHQLQQAEQALEQANVVVVLVDHKQFKSCDKSLFLSKVMIDTRGIV